MKKGILLMCAMRQKDPEQFLKGFMTRMALCLWYFYPRVRRIGLSRKMQMKNENTQNRKK
jgi:hypothetical protein